MKKETEQEFIKRINANCIYVVDTKTFYGKLKYVWLKFFRRKAVNVLISHETE